jgi:hypothetical protein
MASVAPPSADSRSWPPVSADQRDFANRSRKGNHHEPHQDARSVLGVGARQRAGTAARVGRAPAPVQPLLATLAQMFDQMIWQRNWRVTSRPLALVFVRILLTGRFGRVGAQPRGPRLVSTCRAAAGDMFRRLGAPGLTGAVKPPKTILQRVALQIASAARSPYWSRSGEPHRI